MIYYVHPFVTKCNALGSVDAVDDADAIKKAKELWPHVKHPILVCPTIDRIRASKEDQKFWDYA